MITAAVVRLLCEITRLSHCLGYSVITFGGNSSSRKKSEKRLSKLPRTPKRCVRKS